jgi:hypothetical protein
VQGRAGTTCSSDSAGSIDVHILHLEIARIPQATSKIYHNVAVLDSIIDGFFVADVPGKRQNLPNIAHDL